MKVLLVGEYSRLHNSLKEACWNWVMKFPLHKMALKLQLTTIKKKWDSGFLKKLKSEFICCLVLMSARI
jgi:hypothetical protein